MSFIRHIGKSGDRKVAIVFREVPGEPHMCLVVFTEVLNRNIHDPLMQCIEGDIGQTSTDLATALNRSYTQDGQIILQKLHAEGMLKKVNTESIVVTPTPTTRIKLSELNAILDKMEKGEEAVRELAELDKSRGIQDPASVARKMRGDKDVPTGIQSTGDALGDQALATNLLQQAERMQREASGLLIEAQRLTEQAKTLNPTSAAESKFIKTVANSGNLIKKKPGRKPKSAVPVA